MKNRPMLRVAIAQINSTVGDLEGNAAKIIRYATEAKGLGADIICFPELALCGYPPEDLLLKPKFILDNTAAIKELSKNIPGNITAVVGFANGSLKEAYNSAAVIYNGKIKGIYRKIFLPNYGVFDEKRYFLAGDKSLVFRQAGITFGVNICEDIWHPDGPTKSQAARGARLILNINASPYYMGKFKQRQAIISNQAKTNGVFIVYTNLVGGQDELVFDGQSMIVDNDGKILGKAKAFSEDLLIQDLPVPAGKTKVSKNIIKISDEIQKDKKQLLPKRATEILEQVPEVYQALVLGIRDYVEKNGFKKVVIGLSGGIDSAIVAGLAVDALGKENVAGLFMPSRYSSKESEEDAQELAKNLGIRFTTVSIEQIFKFYLLVLEPHFEGRQRDITEENLQARIRGNIMMAFSNKFGWLVLTTGNKSEMSTGYATLYGDMAGGFAVIKDLTKTLVYKVARYRNSINNTIPERIFTKGPTAELKPNQRDQDTLPPYDVLDEILKAYVEEDKDPLKIISSGFDKETVYETVAMVDRNEYKRRQSPPGIKITPKAFGRDRRMPITNKYCG